MLKINTLHSKRINRATQMVGIILCFPSHVSIITRFMGSKNNGPLKKILDKCVDTGCPDSTTNTSVNKKSDQPSAARELSTKPTLPSGQVQNITHEEKQIVPSESHTNMVPKKTVNNNNISSTIKPPFDKSKDTCLSKVSNFQQPSPVPLTSESSTTPNQPSSSVKHDMENKTETETKQLLEKAIKLNIVSRRDAPGNPKAGSEHLTQKGSQVYRELYPKPNPEVTKDPIDFSKTNYEAGIVTIDPDKTIIPRSDQEHILVTTDTGKTLGWGYLTSYQGKGAFKIADKQMDDVKTSDGNDKPQFYLPFGQSVEIPPENFIKNYDADKYLQDAAIAKELDILHTKANNYKPIPYDETGLTIEQLNVVLAKEEIDTSEKALKEAKKQELIQINTEKQKKASQDKKAKAKADAESTKKADVENAQKSTDNHE